jgi:hypothetical protein
VALAGNPPGKATRIQMSPREMPRSRDQRPRPFYRGISTMYVTTPPPSILTLENIPIIIIINILLLPYYRTFFSHGLCMLCLTPGCVRILFISSSESHWYCNTMKKPGGVHCSSCMALFHLGEVRFSPYKGSFYISIPIYCQQPGDCNYYLRTQ